VEQYLLNTINTRISETTQQPFCGRLETAVSGGCINNAFQLKDPQRGQKFFVKTNGANLLHMFEAEALGLNAIAQTQTISVPKVVCWGKDHGFSFLVLQWQCMRAGGQWEEMGRQLAQLHLVNVGSKFGWERHNYIGATVQVNRLESDWITFFCKHRLGYQVQLAEQKGVRFPQFPSLLEALPDLLKGHQPQPSLVHGDLWSGNAAFTHQGHPIIFDPAVYFGDRETDLAMTELFGGFPRSFYQAYEAQYPLTPGYIGRIKLYNLYHILNHFNLFGGSYQHQAIAMMQELL